MAKLPALVTAIAEVDGRDRKTIEYTARTIRERGYITNGKRGVGSPDMTERDAANIIIALNGADTPKDAPLSIDRFRSLRQWWSGTADDLREKAASYDNQPETLQAVADCRTFGEALEALIEGVPDLAASFHAFAVAQFPQAQWDDRLMLALTGGLFGVDVRFERYAAKVELYVMFGSERRVQCDVVFGQDLDRLETGFYGNDRPDRRVKVIIGMPTLVAAWQALHPGEPLPGIPARSVSARDASDDE